MAFFYLANGINEDSSLSDILANPFWGNLIQQGMLQITLVEAKKASLGPNLSKYVPQVAAETLAT